MIPIEKIKTIPVFGIAGNFAEHLAQAGESSDFANIHTEDDKAPKGVFPIYIPNDNSFLGTFPLSDNLIQAHFDEPIQVHMEPEICILFDVHYDDKTYISSLTAKAFSAFNDCSIRRPDAHKISEKKNWGHCCTGVSTHWISVDQFQSGGKLDHYHIASYLERNGELFEYGVDSPVMGYSYFYQQLSQWLVKTFNTQTDFGPLENLRQLVCDLEQPEQLIVSLGATRYTEFGETGFLKPDDKIGIFIYNAKTVTQDDLIEQFNHPETPLPENEVSALIQHVKQCTQI